MRTVEDFQKHIRQRYEAGEEPPYYIYITENEYKTMMEGFLPSIAFQDLDKYETVIRTEYGYVIIVLTDIDDVGE